MRSLRQTCAAIILTLALAVAVLAGEVHCPGVVSTDTTTTTDATTAIVVTVITAAY